jgi:hypothetical protein
MVLERIKHHINSIFSPLKLAAEARAESSTCLSTPRREGSRYSQLESGKVNSGRSGFSFEGASNRTEVNA